MFGFLKHLFIPHERNNHRAKLLHNSSILIIIVVILVLSFGGHLLESARPDILGISYSISEGELLTFVNNERQNKGFAPLTLNSQLSDAARRKAADMLAKNYWAHFAPDGSTSPWALIKAAGYNYTYAGENLAKGFTDSGSVVSAWMNSQTHRENILSDRYKDIGFAIVPGTLTGEETVLIVEMFGATGSQAIASLPLVQTSEIQSPPESSRSSIVLANKKENKQADFSNKPINKGSNQINTNPKIDAQITSKAVSTVGLSFLALAFVLDLLIVERKKIPRIVGHNLDHIMLIMMFILFLILKGSGVIL